MATSGQYQSNKQGSSGVAAKDSILVKKNGGVEFKQTPVQRLFKSTERYISDLEQQYYDSTEITLTGGDTTNSVVDSHHHISLLDVATYTLPAISTIENKTALYSIKNVSGGVCTLARTSTDVIEGETTQEINDGDCYTFRITTNGYEII